ncbi:RNA polymerase I-specific transcription initiation factor RRN6-like protein [Xylogone sp. PMI_703]|nr:RNA polymerase I-specific transcription initiation factor RRN6-like protein [Xylogone sp. PMI_703]
MTDHRVTDLSYGQLGEASYDTHEKEWHFSRSLIDGHDLVQLLPFKHSISSSLNRSLKKGKEYPQHAGKQLRWLIKSHPEAFPANPIASSLAQDELRLPSNDQCQNGNLLVVGRALDADHMSGSRSVRILALPTGESGNVLRFIRPSIEWLGWKEHDGVKVTLMDPSLSADGYWMRAYGPIRQIVPSSEDGAANWFAVRQESMITIFRPLYNKTATSSDVPEEYRRVYRPSRLRSNPVAVLRTGDSSSVTHVDVSFNPWFIRQFGVVDEQGTWSLWIIEGRKRGHRDMEISAGRTGQIYDSNVPLNSDGWHRILWVANVNTIAVCGRRHLAVFDVKAKPTRLNSLDFNTIGGKSDRILDLKRSITNTSHVFVLTASRIFWIEVTPAGEGEGEAFRSLGARVLLSCRHYRDTTSATMKLVVPGDEHVSVLLFSETSLFVNYYYFYMVSGTTMRPECKEGSVMLSSDSDDTMNGAPKRLHTLHMEPAPLKIYPGSESAEGLKYIEHGFKFYQIFCLWSDYSLSSSLCGIGTAGIKAAESERLSIMPPTISTSQGRPIQSGTTFEDTFVVSDGVDDAEEISPYRVAGHKKLGKDMPGLNDLHLRIDFSWVFKKIFLEMGSSGNERANSSKDMASILNCTVSKVQQGLKDHRLPISTLLELSETSEYSDDLGHAADILRQFPQILADQDPDPTTELILSDLWSGPFSPILTPQGPSKPSTDLLRIYDFIIENWVSCLPQDVSNKARMAKFKIIRKIAAELCLSSIAVSLHRKLLPARTDMNGNQTQTLGLQEEVGHDFLGPPHTLQLPLRSVNQNSSPLDFQARESPSVSSLSYGSLAATPETTEDPAITRLRSYAISIRTNQDLMTENSTKLLSYWPDSPQSDPADFVWKGDTRATLPSEDEAHQEESDSRSQLSTRSRRRFESSMSRTPSRSRDTVSQSSRQFGSQQEEVPNLFSSQTMDDFPMTQPDRGIFGSRSVRQTGKKKKKKTASGFR